MYDPEVQGQLRLQGPIVIRMSEDCWGIADEGEARDKLEGDREVTVVVGDGP
jgi:hypothetical protein